ncbi:DUF1007 family protein [Aliagarivorans taiwanensis]|uniref:DUF1007 family protein n=1 Tax=Aliagarivorans taiwanensis TaxID=561966 RepID=UPI00041B6FC5|nr:DUF1007 family protein [Aliagarivorans taiwanensis]
MKWFGDSQRCMFGLRVVAAVVSMIASLSGTALAHPHSWIDVKTLLVGKDGQLTGISYIWQFDPMTSVFMLDGKDLDEPQRQQTLDNMAAHILSNIHYHHYFSKLKQGEQLVAFGEGSQPRVSLQGRVVSFSFYLPLAEPVSLSEQSLSLRVYDPSYFIDMSWRGEMDLDLSIELQGLCEVDIIEPTPSQELINYALSLPADADPDDSLGEMFTQHGEVRCDLL